MWRVLRTFVQWTSLILAFGFATIWAWATPQSRSFASNELKLVVLIDGANFELLWPDDFHRGFWFRRCGLSGGPRDYGATDVALTTDRRSYALFGSGVQGGFLDWIHRHSVLPDRWLAAYDRQLGVHHERTIYVPIPTMIGVLLLLWATRFLLAHRRHEAGRCVTCRYDLTGNTSGRCPECGTVIAETKA